MRLNMRFPYVVVLLAVVSILAAVMLQASLAATTTKPYTDTLVPESVAGGSTTTMTFTITNGANPQYLGSLNLGAPAGFSNASYSTTAGTVDPTSTSTVLRLRNLNLAPGATATVTMSTTAPCAAGTYPWSLQVKQSNDFNGPPGNDFTGTAPSTTVTGSCKLDWGTEPASAIKGTTITGSPYDTSGPSVTVRAVDANGNTITSINGVSVTLGLVASVGCPATTGFANATATMAAGVATFGTYTAANAAYDCVAVGSATGFQSTPQSDPFSIAIAGSTCSGSVGCSLPVLNLDKNTQVSGSTSNGSFEFLAIGPQQIPASVTALGGGCANFQSIGGAVFDAADGAGTGTKTFRYFVSKTIIPKQYSGTSGQQFLPICAGGARIEAGGIVKCTDASDPTGWTDKTLDVNGKFTSVLGKAICDPTTGLWWGILPSFQDYNSGVDPSTNPSVTGWGSGTNSRWFDISVPSPWDWRAGS